MFAPSFTEPAGNPRRQTNSKEQYDEMSRGQMVQVQGRLRFGNSIKLVEEYYNIGLPSGRLWCDTQVRHPGTEQRHPHNPVVN